MVETNKLNSAIHKEEAAIQAAYSQIGETYFETYKDDPEIPPAFRQMLDGVLANMQQIAELKVKIVEVKGDKLCPSCGNEVNAETYFCSKCGYRFAGDPAAVQAASPIPQPSQGFPSPIPQPVQPVQASPQPIPGPEAAAEPISGSAPGKVCSACGNPMPEGMVFCGKCGHKQES
jgi:hypothetical protein